MRGHESVRSAGGAKVGGVCRVTPALPVRVGGVASRTSASAPASALRSPGVAVARPHGAFRQRHRLVLTADELAAGTQLVADVNVAARLALVLLEVVLRRVVVEAMTSEVGAVLAVVVAALHAAGEGSTQAGQQCLPQDDVQPGVEGLVQAGEPDGHQAQHGLLVVRGQGEEDVNLRAANEALGKHFVVTRLTVSHLGKTYSDLCNLYESFKMDNNFREKSSI